MWNRESNVKPANPAPQPVTTYAPPTMPAPEPLAAVPAAPMKAKGSTLVMKGELSGAEDLVLEGRVEGKISLPEHVLTIGAGAEVEAEIVARVVILHGTIVGNIAASERVEIRATGSMTGDLITPRVMISDGASFNGRLETRAPGKGESKGKSKQPELVAV